MTRSITGCTLRSAPRLCHNYRPMIGSVLLVTALLSQSPRAVAAEPRDDDRARLGEAYFLFLKGCSKEGEDDLNGAIAAYREAAERWPSGADIHAQLAGVLGRTGKPDEAITEAKTALTFDADN